MKFKKGDKVVHKGYRPAEENNATNYPNHQLFANFGICDLIQERNVYTVQLVNGVHEVYLEGIKWWTFHCDEFVLASDTPEQKQNSFFD